MKVLQSLAVLALAAAPLAAGATEPQATRSDAVPSPAIVAVGPAFGDGAVRVSAPQWLPDDAPLMRALGVKSADGLGSVVLQAHITDTRFYVTWSGPQTRAIIANDPAALARESSSWYLATWTRAIRPFLVEGGNALFLVRNVPRPSVSRPLAQILITGPANVPGAPSDFPIADVTFGYRSGPTRQPGETVGATPAGVVETPDIVVPTKSSP